MSKHVVNKKITISYHFDQREDIELTEEELEYLDEHAVDRANEMIKQGYTSGELYHIMYRDRENEEDFEIECDGWWYYKIEDVQE